MTIKRVRGGKALLMNKEGTKVLGKHDSVAEARAQEKAIEASKRAKASGKPAAKKKR